MMQLPPLTAAEEQLMQLFWKLENFYMKDAIDRLPEPKPHKNTISTYLKILVEKGYLDTEKQGRIYRYSVAVPLSDYKRIVTKELLAKFYNNSGSQILKFLFHEKLISQKDLADYTDVKMEIEKSEDLPAFHIANEVLKAKKKKKKKKK